MLANSPLMGSGKQYVAPFDPFLIPNLRLALQADVPAQFNLTGTLVNSWTYSTFAASAASSNRPNWISSVAAFNNKPVVRFNPTTNQFLVSPNNNLATLFNFGGARTYFIVASRSGAAAFQNMFGFVNSGSTNDFNIYALDASNRDISQVRVDGSSTQQATGTATLGTAPAVFCYTWGNARNSWVNGTASITTPATTDTPSIDRHIIGATRAGGSYSAFFNGDIAEIWGISRVVTTLERTNMQTLLGTKYNIAIA